MIYNKVYRGHFYNQETTRPDNEALDVAVTIDIYDTISGEAESATEILPLELTDNPLLLETVDNDEDKFKTIVRSLRATVQLYSSDSIGIETFVDGGDSKFYSEIYIGDYMVIKGFVSVADVQEEFMPDPNIIQIVVSDGLGFANDEELRDENGNVPTGVNNIWYYIRLALLQTGQSLPAQIVFNIREKFANHINDSNNNLGHFFQYCSLEAKHLEGENPGTMLTAREVLERLLFGCFLTQYNGNWLIVSIDEMQYDSGYNIASADIDGTISPTTLGDFVKSIGDGLSLSWMNDDALVSVERPLKKLDLKSTYEYPEEIPCNIDFERGTGAEPTGAADETIDYDPECWTLLREGVSNVDLDSAPFIGSTGVLRKRFENNYEKERYFVVGTAGGFRHYFKSEGMRMAEKSKYQIGFQWRSETDTGGVTVNVAHMRLIGDDGTIWDWNLTTGGVSSWVLKAVTDPVFGETWQQTISGIDDSEWQSISAMSQPAPVDGTLYIRLMNDLSTPMRHFGGLQVSYTPLINNSYAKYTGERHTVEQTGDVKAFREDEIKIGSFPDRNIKGCLLKRGDNREIFSGTVSFGTSGQFEITGDERPTFQPYIGQIIVIEGSTSNDQEAEIVSINYSIIGNVTTVFTSGTTTTELLVAVTVSLATYVRAELFYNATVLPDGPFEDAQSKPYGENIVFNIWNQYNRVMRKFEGTVDGLDSDSFPPHLIHKYVLTDGNPNTGTRAFMALHFGQNFHLCESDFFLIEIHNPENGKVYENHSFKYLTE